MRYLFGFLYVCALGVMPLVGCSDTQPECESAEGCNDGNECTDDACSYASGTCSNTPVDDGTNCDFDGTAGLCISGVCEDATLCEGVECEDRRFAKASSAKTTATNAPRMFAILRTVPAMSRPRMARHAAAGPVWMGSALP
jgi:hypothetical protein